jgi:hypothetical protein
LQINYFVSVTAFLTSVLTGALSKSVQNTRPKTRMPASAEHPLDAARSDSSPIIPNDIPEWAGDHLNQAQVYGIPSINVKCRILIVKKCRFLPN